MKKLVLACMALVFMSSCSVFKKQPKEEIVTITTEMGTVDLMLYKDTPMHRANFLKLAKQGYYDGTSFHRIIDGFMIQGGDPNSKDANPDNDGNGGPGYTIPAEFVPAHTHNKGALAAARLGDNQNPKKESSGSQFYIVENADGTHFLDNSYTVFGQVVKGMETVERIAEQKKNPMDRPLKDIKMTVTVKSLSAKKLKEEYGIAPEAKK